MKGNGLINAEADSAAHMSAASVAGLVLAGVELISFMGAVFQLWPQHKSDNTGMVWVCSHCFSHCHAGLGKLGGDTAGKGDSKTPKGCSRLYSTSIIIIIIRR